MKMLFTFGATGGVFFALVMPYMPSSEWSLLILLSYVLGSVAFFNWYRTRKGKKE